MRRVIYIYPKRASFIDTDLQILAKNYDVIENTGNWSNKSEIPFLIIKQLIFLLRRINKVDFIIISFGGYWAFIPTLIGKLFKRKTFIILHGTDVSNFKEIDYGLLRKKYLKILLGICYNMASGLLPVSKSLIYTENSYFSSKKTIRQGVNAFFPYNKVQKKVISNVFDGNKWKAIPEIKRHSNRFITVLGDGQFVRKGGELILEVAKQNSHLEFFFVGMNKSLIKNYFPDNVFFIDKVKPEKLCELYSGAKYYLQLSIFEGFGCALCEAMLCGCIPIVSSVNALPDIVENTGFVLKQMNSALLTSLIQEIQSKDNINLGIKARKRILDKYPLKIREEALGKILV